ncbi:MAG: acireductone synthase [Gaiellaceae bacterium]
MSIRAVLLDIEGTTTPIAFVHDVLFGYARERLEPFLRDGWDEPDTRADVAALRAEAGEDEDDADLEWALSYVRALMDEDRKSTALKSLQGRIWKAGYRDGTLVAEVYPDVPRALERWRTQGRDVCIFSSGSVLGQRLLFEHTNVGDLTPHLRGYFDTTTGPKREPASYTAIAAALGLAPAEMLFASDVVAELDAARETGMSTLLCVRDGEVAPDESGGHEVIHDFDGVLYAARVEQGSATA